MKKMSLIYGGGAIGSFLTCCLLKSNHQVFFLTRGKNFDKIKKRGLKVDIYRNAILKKKFFFKENERFKIIDNLKKLKNIRFNYIFVTTSINENLIRILKNVEPYINEKKTLVITPCTSVPFWWYECLRNKYKSKLKKNLHNILKKNIKRKNLVGMTMWLSGKIVRPGSIKISHIQRGFPIKEVFYNKKRYVEKKN